MSARILTVRNPWAWSLIYAGKDVENRTRNIAGSYRGPVLIHAGMQLVGDDDPAWEVPAYRDALARETSVNRHRLDVRGAIIGVVDLVDVHYGDWCWDGPLTHCSQWADPDAHHLVLENPRALDEPIPYKGGLGLRKTSFDIAGQWLVEATDRCTCGAGTSLGAVFGHEPGCGYEPVALLLEVDRG